MDWPRGLFSFMIMTNVAALISAATTMEQNPYAQVMTQNSLDVSKQAAGNLSLKTFAILFHLDFERER